MGGSQPPLACGSFFCFGGDLDSAVAGRFWSKVVVAAPEQCWEWKANRQKRRRDAARRIWYGTFRISNPRRTVGAHRVSWELAYGPIPDGLAVLHRCDNPGCVNPAHLFLGTIQDNNADMRRKGRYVMNTHGVSRFKGVWPTESGKWLATVWIKSKRRSRYLGTFSDEALAGLVAAEARAALVIE